MKKLILLALITVSLTAFAQNKRAMHPKGDVERFTPEQKNEVLLKKLTLELDLDSKQQQEIKTILAERSTQRNARMQNKPKPTDRPTAEERLASKNKMLDEKIALKTKMKRILSPDQYNKWEEKNERNKRRKHDKMSQ
ncbi:hypothetical protein [Flavobacterium crassostreae]|uniref:DUF4890 domain-containing protein n=1 Tax=Flavobacterium crassostreae TaxID=1763534 RepID=A0A1B9E814_9FLAO|nr:hypothetical protein [Flavobacterium crassostreae]OCB78085.1 hypothetical protein LPBF_03835 [Flavobacterium crassostreae]